MVSGRKIVFALGGVRSGKSRFALSLATELAGGSPVRFIATAPPRDDDPGMALRIERHKRERPEGWTTAEEPLDLPRALSAPGRERVAVVDCLTLWLSNVLLKCGDADSAGFPDRAMREVTARVDALIAALASCQMHVILIANDVGSGVAPVTALGNAFADAQGETSQRVAAIADEVYHLIAGIPQRIK
jgi:adenosylcobinamide kinase/adenosylcobinamide-phosphate guanylyltransferase